MMMSGPVPDWIAEVMRACTSLPLMVSTLSVMPVALWHSCVIWPSSSTSEAGTKSAQPSQWTVVPCANAGARPAARTAARWAGRRSPRTAILRPTGDCSTDSFCCPSVLNLNAGDWAPRRALVGYRGERPLSRGEPGDGLATRRFSWIDEKELARAHGSALAARRRSPVGDAGGDAPLRIPRRSRRMAAVRSGVAPASW